MEDGKPGRRKPNKRDSYVRELVADAEPISYAQEARSDFIMGDILCFRGKGLSSRIIRAATRSLYSHCGLVYRYQGRVYCLEAIGSAGVRLALMSTLMKRYQGGVDYFEVLGAEEQHRETALGFGFQQLGQVYDNHGIIRFARAILFRKRDVSGLDDESWFCSELVAAAYTKAEYPLVQLHAAYTSPEDLASSPKLKFRRRLKA